MGVGEQLQEQLKRIEEKLDRLLVSAPVSNAAGGVAPDSELDGKFGDPEVRKDPPRWSGDSFAGRKFSECSAEFLDVLAEFKEWQAQADERRALSMADDEREKKLKYAKFGRLDAARARGWSARIRKGWKPATTQAEPYNGDW